MACCLTAPSHYLNQCCLLIISNVLWHLPQNSLTVGGQATNLFNSLRPRPNRRHVADDIFKCIFLNENVWIPIKISLKFVSKGPINNIPALVQIMAWRRSGDKPLSEPMMVNLPTHICVIRPQWVKGFQNYTFKITATSPRGQWVKSHFFSSLFLFTNYIISALPTTSYTCNEDLEIWTRDIRNVAIPQFRRQIIAKRKWHHRKSTHPTYE